MEAPLKELTFTPQPDQKNQQIDAALLRGREEFQRRNRLRSLVKTLAVQVALDKVDAYKEGNLVQTFRTELPPGSYSLEAALMDRNGRDWR